MTKREYFIQKLSGEFSGDWFELRPYLVEDGYLTDYDLEFPPSPWTIRKAFIFNSRKFGPVIMRTIKLKCPPLKLLDGWTIEDMGFKSNDIKIDTDDESNI